MKTDGDKLHTPSPGETRGFLMHGKGQRGAGRGLCLLLFAIGFDSTKSADDAMIAEFGEGIGAQTIIASVIGEAGLAVDFQVDIKVGEFVFAILK